MKRYRVTITETFQKDVWVEAESPQEAENKLRKSYDEDPRFYDLNVLDYQETEVECFDMVGKEINC